MEAINLSYAERDRFQLVAGSEKGRMTPDIGLYIREMLAGRKSGYVAIPAYVFLRRHSRIRRIITSAAAEKINALQEHLGRIHPTDSAIEVVMFSE